MLAAAMGTGKSRVAIEAALKKSFSPILIICPLRVVEVWRQQFERHAPEAYDFLALDNSAGSVVRKTATARDRLAWCNAKQRPLVIAINYESAFKQPFQHWALTNIWPLIIADECHRISNPSGAISRFMGRLAKRAVHRLGLTGTPMPHDPLNVWAQFRFLDHNLYDPTFTAFRLKYAIMGEFFNGNQAFRRVVGWQNIDELRQKFFSLAFQVGAEVLDLPPESDQDLFTDFEPEGARIYRAMETDLVARLQSGEEIVAQNKLSQLLRLQQITSGSLTYDNHETRRFDFSKGKLLEDLLEDLPQDEPVVIFVKFRPDLILIHDIARKLGRRSGEISGQRSIATGRRDDLAEWQRGGADDPVLLVVQMQSGGLGIDLTRARYGVYFSVGFSLADYVQSRARLQRAGQTRSVMFYHLFVHGTVDEMVARALQRRQDLVDYVLKELRCSRLSKTTTGILP
jgi:SNF2 family DNA or RNA helicase